MAGLNSSPHAITPGRRTWVVYRAAVPQLVNRPWGQTRQFTSLSQSDWLGMAAGTIVRPGVGLQLEQVDEEYQTSTITGGLSAMAAGVVAAGFVEKFVNRSYPEVTGSGSGSSLAPQSGVMYERTLAANESLEDDKFRLPASMEAFPGPGFGTDGVQMDRVFVAEESNEGRLLKWVVGVETHNRLGNIPLMRGYFNGPAGRDPDFIGYGQYCVIGYRNGNTILAERGQNIAGEEPFNEWRIRQKASAAGLSAVGPRAALWAMTVWSLYDEPRILISWNAIGEPYGKSEQSMASVDGAIAGSVGTLGSAATSSHHGYTPMLRGANVRPPTHTMAHMIDVPRPFKNSFSVVISHFRSSGTFKDRQFIAEAPHWGDLIRVEAFGKIPEGTDVTIKLFRADDNTEIAADSSGAIGGDKGRFAEFDPGTDSSFYALLTLTSDGRATPTIKGLRYLRNGRFDESYPTAIELRPMTKKGSRVSIVTGGADPTTDSASWSHVDLWGHLDAIKNVGVFPVRIETEWDPEDPSKRCVLFGGICERKPRKRRRTRSKAGISKGVDGDDLPVPVGWEYQFTSAPLTFVGSVQRTIQYSLAIASEEGEPRKATDAIKLLLNWCGWPFEQMDIPDLGIRLFPCQGMRDLSITPHTDMIEVAIWIARTFLNAGLCFDWNTGELGKWKLLQIPSAPYTNKVHFTTAETTDGKVFGLNSYPAIEDVPVCPVTDLEIQDRRPEANDIEVYGGVGGGKSMLASPEPGQNGRFSQRWVNPKSFRVDPEQEVTEEDMEGEDWVGFRISLLYIDPYLQSRHAVDFVTERLRQQLGHGYKVFHAEAPLILIPHEDDAERRRPLRFGDPVIFEDEGVEHQCIVRGTSPGYTKDSKQMSVYELETVRVL